MAAHGTKIRNILLELESMWDVHLSCIKAARHKTELWPEDRRSFLSVPHRAGPEECKVEKNEIAESFELKVIEPAQHEWASPSVLAQTNGGMLQVCVAYGELRALTCRVFYLIPVWTSASLHWEM